MLDLNEFARDVHDNSVRHGWWETDRPLTETLALIHSEWSEALEEARAGRPMEWYECAIAKHGVCDFRNTDCKHKNQAKCFSANRNPKPEGIAVELADGCIRIFDLIGKSPIQMNLTLDELIDSCPDEVEQYDISRLVVTLHLCTSVVFDSLDESWTVDKASDLLMAVGAACRWIKHNGCDPEKILRRKHEFNKTRQYKHGKRF